ncbi:MAG TPA: DUF5666 domain-containing protein [Anaerolineales bacterium]|nr:DUF5666 domain-containing protein [Anaerolineales bacterium]
MGTNNKSVLRWPFVVGYLGIITSMLACMAFGIEVGSTSTKAEAGVIQIDNGVVAVVDESGDSVPVAGTSTFELVAPLEATDPWTVAGRTIATNESTQIEDGLQVGDLVRVRGTILDDSTWLAYSIEPAEEAVDPIIILIGTVDSVDPWVVNGITLNVTADTVITGEITAGMLVRVEILLLEDGTWEVLSISLLGDITEVQECATVIATVVAVNGNQVQFLGWPSITLGEDVVIEGSEAEGEPGGVLLNPDADVIVVVCPSEEGQIVIVQIIIINIVINPPGEDVGTPGEGEKVLVCHKPDKKKGGNTLSISSSAVPAHLGHGDFLGACP